jgi:uncharacterized membrane protein YedE/YeeE/rhodanese-related sulfurtransferase
MKILAFIIVGISCGVLFARYQVCAASAVRNFLAFRRKEKLVLFACIVIGSAIVFNVLIGLGLLTPTVKPFFPLAIVGGIIFGIGMVIAGGSTEGILYRLGEGNVPAGICTLGMIVGMGAFGFVVASRFTSRPPHFVDDTLLRLFGIPPLVFAIVLAVLSVLAIGYMLARKPEARKKLALVVAIACILALNAGMLRASFFLGESECKTLSPLVFQEMIDGGQDMVILDIRGKPMYDQGHISGSISIADLPNGLKDMRQYEDRMIVVVCGVGLVSKLDCVRLNKMGFKKVYNLEGGLKNYGSFQRARRSMQ